MNKFVVAVFDLCRSHHDRSAELVLVHLDHAESVGHNTDLRSPLMLDDLPVPAVTEKQAVIGLSSSYKSLRVLDQLLLGDFISNQIIQIHMSDSGNRYDHRLAILTMLVITQMPCSIPACLHRNLSVKLHQYLP